jgi:hypothetical protein
MSNVPLRATRHHHLSLDGSLATLTARREEFVEIKMTVKPHGFVGTVFLL